MAAAEIEDDFILTEEDALDDVARLNAEVIQVRQMFEELRTEVTLQRERANTQANRADQAVRELEAFKARVVDIGRQAAEDHDWCGVYDEVMGQLGLPGRVRSFEVEVRITYETSVSVDATSQDDAEAIVNDTDLNSRWRPTSPFADTVSMAGLYANNVGVEII